MDGLAVARLMHRMTACTTPETLATVFLQATVTALTAPPVLPSKPAMALGVCYGLDGVSQQLWPLAMAGLKQAPRFSLEDMDNPLVYSLTCGKSYQINQLAALAGLGEAFEQFRLSLPQNHGFLALPLAASPGKSWGVLMLVGHPATLTVWRNDTLWQMIVMLYVTFAVRLNEASGAARVTQEQRIHHAQEKERLKARAVRLLAAEFVGTGRVAQALRETIQQIADSSLAVLITGETGTGKDYAAWLIHQISGRSGDFVPVNCAAIPEALIESELFGCVRGAFTGAVAHRGLVGEADGGTLFLDEIGDMPLSLQTRLLRLLNEKKYRPVGSPRELHSDFRLLYATHQPVRQRIQEGRFREDLYFRILQQTLHLPPLRERLDDIPALAAHILLHYHRESSRRELAHRVAGLTPSALALLCAYSFPGNVRELRSLLLVAAERTAHGMEISEELIRALVESRAAMFQHTIAQDSAAPGRVGGSGREGDMLQHLWETRNLTDALAMFERLLIDQRLRKLDGCRRRAAESLGIPKRTFARKCQNWNLDQEKTS